MRELSWRLGIVAMLVLSSINITAHAGGRLDERQAERHSSRLAQSSTVTREFLPGEWYTRNLERGQVVEIRWSVMRDGTLSYKFVVDGVEADGSRGTWSLDGDRLTEVWQGPFGLTGTGTARLERIDDNTLRLTIIDNGDPDYAGKVRIYRRRGGPQVSMLFQE